MGNPLLTEGQLVIANRLLDQLRRNLEEEAGDDPALLWALRRKVAKELVYDERGKPGHRRKIKALKRKEQGNTCPLCGEELPESYCVLDRFEAMAGYTVENTRLIHQECDQRFQSSKGYT